MGKECGSVIRKLQLEPLIKPLILQQGIKKGDFSSVLVISGSATYRFMELGQNLKLKSFLL